jgi:hypothetical protein
MLKRGLSVQFAGDRERRGSPALFGHRTIESKTSERSLFVPTLFSPCAHERHAQ